MAKLYTRTGDKGETGLLSGARVGKDDPRVEAYGTVDETNVAVGSARVEVLEEIQEGPGRTFLLEVLDGIQDALMRLAAQLASEDPGGVGVMDRDVEALEAWIDSVGEQVSEARHFLLPGVSRTESAFHTARTTCRRAERKVVSLLSTADTPEIALQYLNRLSDLLFALVRFSLAVQEKRERIWRGS